jgi:hypothetical protein
MAPQAGIHRVWSWVSSLEKVVVIYIDDRAIVLVNNVARGVTSNKAT